MQKFLMKMMPGVVKFANFKVVKALKNGFIRTVPITLIGSIFLLIANFPIQGFIDLMASWFGENWASPLNQVVAGTFNILAIYVAFAIAYEYCKEEGIDGVPAGFFGIAGLFAMINASVLTEGGELVTSVVPNEWIGSKGLIAALICSLISGMIYTWFIKRDIRIKLPETVPPAVATSFSALIPGVVILAVFGLMHMIIGLSTNLSVTEAIYMWLQTPLQNLTDTLPGIILVAMLISLFWWCGIHGDAIILGILTPVLQSNMLANQDVINAGGTLVAGQNAHIITDQFTLFLKAGGAGSTIGLIICMVLFAKSKQLKELGKLAFGPSIFNINEPIIFGTPIIYNPVMLLPFMLTPVACVTISYIAIATGLCPPFTGVTVPWTMPTIISGLITGGWRTALLQVVNVCISVAIYFPFLKMQDKLLLDQEAEAEAALESSSAAGEANA